MTKVVVTIELDNVEYDKAYGPGSEFWEKYNLDREYKSLEGQALRHNIVEILSEGFYDWDKHGWLTLTIDGKAVRKCCGTVEGDSHRSYCETIAGPEATA